MRLNKMAHSDQSTEAFEFYRAQRQALIDAHAYDPATERDACGVGLVCAIDGKPRRDVVVLAVKALKALFHRGAVDADGKSGDGAGIMLGVPQAFFAEQIKSIGQKITRWTHIGRTSIPTKVRFGGPRTR